MKNISVSTCVLQMCRVCNLKVTRRYKNISVSTCVLQMCKLYNLKVTRKYKNISVSTNHFTKFDKCANRGERCLFFL